MNQSLGTIAPAVVLGAVGMWLLLPRPSVRGRLVGAAMAAIGAPEWIGMAVYGWAVLVGSWLVATWLTPAVPDNRPRLGPVAGGLTGEEAASP